MAKTSDRIRAILELARNGVGGEAENAQRIADSLGLSDEDFPEDVHLHIPYRSKNERRIAIQVVYAVLNRDEVFICKNMDGVRNRLSVLVPPDRVSAISEAITTVVGLYRKEMELCHRAFIHANHLYSQKKSEEDSDYELTDEERSDCKQIFEKMMTMRTASVSTALLPKNASGGN